MDLEEIIDACGFSDDERAYATQEACGSFALALHDELTEAGETSQIILIAEDPEWEPLMPGAEPPRKLPSRLKWEHFNHVAVLHGVAAYDIRGRRELRDLVSEVDGTGVIAVDRVRLRRKMGGKDAQPLYFDGEFYNGCRQRIADAMALISARLRL